MHLASLSRCQDATVGLHDLLLGLWLFQKVVDALNAGCLLAISRQIARSLASVVLELHGSAVTQKGLDAFQMATEASEMQGGAAVFVVFQVEPAFRS